MFENTRVKVAYSINNTIKNNCNAGGHKDKYISSGIYRLWCLSCDEVYVGQMRRNL
jgi:hypothetical protein